MIMTERASFCDLVQSRFTPVIAVQASAEVQATCSKNGLTLVDLLRACSEGAGVGSQGFPFRVEKGTVRVEGAFQVRFYDAATMRPTPVPRANEHLHQTWVPRLMRRHGDVMEEFASSSVLEAISGRTGISKITPWFTEYTHEFIRTTLFQSHETIDHPLGIIYAVDIHSPDCTTSALDLLRPHLQPRADDPSIPPAMASAAVLPFWDPDFPRHFVLVADASQGALTSEQIKSKAEALVKAVNSTIAGGSTPRVSVLTLNSGSGSQDEAGAAIDWARHMYSTLPSRVDNADTVVPSAGEPLERPALESEADHTRGCWLSARNLDDTRTLISTVIRDTLCNSMEQRMSAVRGTVQQHRGGILRSFTKAVGLSSRIARASKGGSATGVEPTFGYDSPECQLRLLGDMYFMIGQYHDAEGCYIDAASEFKSQKAVRHWAAALEALALSRFMQMAVLGSMAMELWRHDNNCRPMDDAFRAYASLQQATSSRAPGSAILTARCGLLFGGLMAAVGQMEDAFACYYRASNFAEPVLGAMLLEQAALCQARMVPARLRKAVQYLTLAGIRYQHQRLPGLAVVAFRGVASHLTARWPAASSTVSGTGAMACQNTAKWRDSALYLCAALSTPAVLGAIEDANASQQLLLQLRRALCNARDVAEDLFRDPEILALRVPQVDDSSVPMQLRGVRVCMHVERSGDSAGSDLHWKVMGEAAAQKPEHKHLLTRPKSKRQYTIMFADEPLHVHVTISNPLPADVRVQNFRLACSCVEADAASADGTGTFPSSILVPADLKDLCQKSDESADMLVVEPQTFTLGAKQSETRMLLVRPTCAAWMYIGGVRWQIKPATDVAASLHSSHDGAQEPQSLQDFDQSDPPLEAACMFKPSVKRLRYGTSEESRSAGQRMRGMMINAAKRAADAAQPPRLHFTERTCLAFRVLPPGPLVMLRPAESVGSLCVEPVPREIPTKVFATWPSHKRPVMMPASLLQGELVPLAFVLSRVPGCTLRNARLLTTNPDISLHPEVEAGSVPSMKGHEMLQETEHFWKPTSSVRQFPSYHDSDLPLQRFPIDTGGLKWVPAKDSMEHAALTVWMHPRRQGEQHLRLMLAYEDDQGAFRMTTFADTVHVRPAVVHRPGRMQPVVGSLDLWTLSVKVHASQTILGLSSVFTLHLKDVMMQSQEWECISAVANDEEQPLGDTTVTTDVVESTPLDAVVQPGGVSVALRLQRRSPTAQAEAPPARNQLRLMIQWELRSAHACPHVGLFKCHNLRPLELVRDCAVRMRVEADGVAAGSGAVVLNGVDDGGLHRDVPVVLRLHNGGADAVSLCVECGDAALQEGELAGGHARPGGSGSTHALQQGTRHLWLGPMRRHVKQLEPLDEITLHACIRLLGYGPAVVQDYICSWRALGSSDVQGVVVGEALHFVLLPQEASSSTTVADNKQKASADSGMLMPSARSGGDDVNHGDMAPT